MKKQKVIDFLKLRASYGIVGNDKMEKCPFPFIWQVHGAVIIQ